MIYNVIDFGAVADGETLCTKAGQKAIDVCHKNGGGIVEFAAGILAHRHHLHYCLPFTLGNFNADVKKLLNALTSQHLNLCSSRDIHLHSSNILTSKAVP